jgi:DNA modification methylase
MRVLNSTTKNEPIDAIKPHPQNPRQGDLGAIHHSIETNGFYGTIIAQRSTGHILAGNHRWQAAQQAKAKTIPVTWIDVDDDHALRILLADNRTNDLATYNDNALAGLLKELQDATGTLDGTGYDGDDLDQLLADLGEKPEIIEDEVPAPPEVPITQPGDLWLLGDHRLLCGDSTKAEDVERLMAGAKADMVFTDPPYGVSFVGVKGTMYSGGNKVGANSAEQIIGDDLRGDDLTALFRDALALAVDYSKPSAALYLFFAINRSEETLPAVSACGLTVRNWLIWDKGNVGFHAMGAQYKPNFEAFLYAVKGEPPEWRGNQSQQTIWRHSVERLGLHPTMKPVSLVGQAIMNHSPNSILDPFLGSGTTLIAAEQLGRKCYGMEISPQYCDVIVKRWETLTGKQATRETPHNPH